MSWKRALFKGKKVWVEVNAEGQPVVVDRRSPIRYSSQPNAKIYHGYSDSIQLEDGEEHEMPKGKPVKKASSGLGSSKTRTEQQKVKAQQVAKDLLAGFADEAVVCFTDGACRGNPGPAGSGVFIMHQEQSFSAKKYLGNATNNVAELTAIELALQQIECKNIPKGVPTEILTDSRYSHGVLTLNWKAKSNRSLIMKIRAMIRGRGNTRVHWIAGHAGIEQNEIADELANQAIAEQ